MRRAWAFTLVLLLVIVVLLAYVLAERRPRRRAAHEGGAGARRGAGVGVLFHGSPRELDVLRPAPSPVVGNEEYVFGTPSRWLALVFSTQARSKDLDFGFAGVPYIAEMYPGAFELLKKPGYVHLVPAEGFRSDPRLGMPGHEYVRPGKVAVAEVERVPDVYEDLRRFPDLRFVAAADRAAFYREKGIPE